MMKTRLFRVLSISLVLLSLFSCGTVRKVQEYTPSRGYELGSSKRLNGHVFQTINNHQALVELTALDNKPYSSYDKPLVYIVTPSSSKEYYFDKLAIRGVYYFIGTHRYKTVNKDFDQFKTVPVFVEKKYYVEGMEWNDWYERIDTPATEPEPETTDI